MLFMEIRKLILESAIPRIAGTILKRRKLDALPYLISRFTLMLYTASRLFSDEKKIDIYITGPE